MSPVDPPPPEQPPAPWGAMPDEEPAPPTPGSPPPHSSEPAAPPAVDPTYDLDDGSGDALGGGRRSSAPLVVALAVGLVAGAAIGALGTVLLTGEEPDREAAPVPTTSTSPSSDLPGGGDFGLVGGLDVIEPAYGEGIDAICERDAVLGTAAPYPAEPELAGELRAVVAQQQLAYRPGPRFELVESDREWAATSYDQLNAALCVRRVPGTMDTRLSCSGAGAAGEGEWRVYTADWVVEVVDPSTGRLVTAGEPFSSSDVTVTPDCADVPPDLEPGEPIGVLDLADPEVVLAQVDVVLAGL